MEIVELTGTCDASGDLTITSTQRVVGYIEKIVMDYDDGDTGADIVFTNEDGAATTAVMTLANLGTADATWMPRSACNAVSDGSAFTNWADKIFVTGTMKAVISNGGISKNFRFLVTVVDA
jgi:hypothetical protein